MAIRGAHILVVGAGIAGLAAALALARRGARVRVFEQAEALGEVGAGLQLGPNGVAVLEALGLRDRCAGLATMPAGIELRDKGGAILAAVPLGEVARARYGRPYWQMHRADLAAVLAEEARAAGVEFVLGARVTRIAEEGGAPRIWTEDGGGATGSILIGADGVRSPIRRAHFGGATPRYTGAVAWRGLVPAGRLTRGHGAVTRVFMGPGRHLVSYPLRGGSLINFVAVKERPEPRAEDWGARDDPADLRAAFSGWAGEVEELLGAVERTFIWGLYDHEPLADWARGRVALIGDACHPMVPFLAQGAAMGLEDAWVLAEALDGAPTPEAGLAAYAARRMARATRVQRAAARNGKLYHLSGAVPRAVAHAGLRVIGAVAPARLLARFDWLYGADVTGEA